MRSVSLVLIVFVAAMASAAPASDKPHYDVSNAKALFEDFMKKYDRNYEDDADKDAHYQAFVKTLEEINNLNAKSTFAGSATYDINKFADYTEAEKKNLFGLRIPDNKKN